MSNILSDLFGEAPPRVVLRGAEERGEREEVLLGRMGSELKHFHSKVRQQALISETATYTAGQRLSNGARVRYQRNNGLETLHIDIPPGVPPEPLEDEQEPEKQLQDIRLAIDVQFMSGLYVTGDVYSHEEVEVVTTPPPPPPGALPPTDEWVQQTHQNGGPGFFSPSSPLFTGDGYDGIGLNAVASDSRYYRVNEPLRSVLLSQPSNVGFSLPASGATFLTALDVPGPSVSTSPIMVAYAVFLRPINGNSIAARINTTWIVPGVPLPEPEEPTVEIKKLVRRKKYHRFDTTPVVGLQVGKLEENGYFTSSDSFLTSQDRRLERVVGSGTVTNEDGGSDGEKLPPAKRYLRVEDDDPKTNFIGHTFVARPRDEFSNQLEIDVYIESLNMRKINTFAGLPESTFETDDVSFEYSAKPDMAWNIRAREFRNVRTEPRQVEVFHNSETQELEPLRGEDGEFLLDTEPTETLDPEIEELPEEANFEWSFLATPGWEDENPDADPLAGAEKESEFLGDLLAEECGTTTVEGPNPIPRSAVLNDWSGEVEDMTKIATIRWTLGFGGSRGEATITPVSFGSGCGNAEYENAFEPGTALPPPPPPPTDFVRGS